MFSFLPGGSTYDSCPEGMVWSDLSQDCVISVDAGGTPLPGSGGIDSQTMTLVLVGLGALLLLSFMGGRASKKSGSRLISRTSTRSVFA